MAAVIFTVITTLFGLVATGVVESEYAICALEPNTALPASERVNIQGSFCIEVSHEIAHISFRLTGLPADDNRYFCVSRIPNANMTNSCESIDWASGQASNCDHNITVLGDGSADDKFTMPRPELSAIIGNGALLYETDTRGGTIIRRLACCIITRTDQDCDTM